MAFNWAEALKGAGAGALAGAGTGALAGAPVAGVGAAFGAAGGGLLGGILGLLNGMQPDEAEQLLSRFPPEVQQQIMQQYMSASQGNPQGFEPFAQQARQNFNTQTIPGLAERFTAMGGGQRSSAFQGALGNAGANLEGQLAGLKSQYGLQQQNQLLPMLEQNYQTRQPGFAENALAGSISALPSLVQGYGLQQRMNKLGGGTV